MSTMLHSPAPFGASAALSSDHYNIRYITDCEGNHIATVRHLAGMSQEEALANAALFKAAPALLAALEDALRVIEALMPGVKYISVQDYALLNDAPLAARKALAEAKGTHYE